MEGDEINSPTQVHLHQCTQHGQETGEAGAIVQQDSYNLVTNTETKWDDSHDWSAAVVGYILLEKDKPAR